VRPDRRPCAGNPQPEFRYLTRRFAVFAAAIAQIAAMQRGWRDFRIAPCSRERDDATLPKIWTPSVAAISPVRTVEASMNQRAVANKSFRVKPGT